MNAETPPHLLDDAITPTERHFVRNNGIPPDTMDAASWQLTVDGLVDKPMTLTIDELKDKFEVVTRALTLECGGNGRAFFDPPAKGNQWTYGAVACSEWTGVRLADVLKAAGVKSEVVYTAHEGADAHLSGEEGKLPISRGVPIEKAMDENNLIAFAQNGAGIHPMNGAPLRLVIPGWPGSCSQKWLTRIWLRDQVHDGAKMTGTSYRVPNRTVAPGEAGGEGGLRHHPRHAGQVPDHQPNDRPRDRRQDARGPRPRLGRRPQGRGPAGLDRLRRHLGRGRARRSGQRPRLAELAGSEIEFPQAGYYEVWARAIDSQGDGQPHAIAWNPKGYLNNSMHRVAVVVG